MSKLHIRYFQNNYGRVENINVVFDGGYLNHSTKDTTHLRRSNRKQGRSIVPTCTNSLAVKKNEFLMSKNNKQELMLMLGSQISDPGVSVYHANTDDDFITIGNALALANDLT